MKGPRISSGELRPEQRYHVKGDKMKKNWIGIVKSYPCLDMSK